MKDVVITAIGSVSAAATDWAGLLAAGADGASAFSPWPEEAGPPGPTALIGQIKAYDRKRYLSASDQRVADKFAAIMTLAAGDALSAAGLLQGLSASGLGDQIATITGTSKPEFGGFYKFGQPVLSGQAGRTNPALFPYMARNVACGQMCITFGLRGYSSNMAAGPLSGLHAIARAYELLRTGRVAVALAGGGECLSKSSLRMNRILFKGHHRAAAPEFFGHQPALHVPAEGATMLVMETLENARARGRQPLARVTGATVGRWRPGTTLADMANRLEQHLLPRCGLDWPHVDLVSSGATGAGLPVDLQESALLRHLSDRSGHAPAVTACRALTGDAEAASSALQAAVAAEAVRGGTVLPTPGAALDTSLNVVVGNPALAVKRALVSALDPDGGFAFLGLAAA